MPIDIREGDEPDTRTEAECFPDVDPGVELLGDRVLVQLRREKLTSKGGIFTFKRGSSSTSNSTPCCIWRGVPMML